MNIDDNLKSLTEFSDQSKAEIRKKIWDLDTKIDEITVKILETQKKLQKLGGGRKQIEENYDIIISIESDGDGSFEYSVTYQIANAYWVPFYDVNISEEKTTMNYMSNVINKTLEDWEDVNLEISTATFKPVRITDPNPWYISVYQPYVRAATTLSAGFGGRRDMAKMKKMAPSAAPMEMKEREVEEELEDLMEPEPVVTEMEIDKDTLNTVACGRLYFPGHVFSTSNDRAWGGYGH